MNPFKKLSAKDKKALLTFPAYTSMLAAYKDDKLNESEKEIAIKLSYTATFKCDPILTGFYMEADKVFEKNIAQLDKDLPIDKNDRASAIQKELFKLEKIVQKLGKKYTLTMQQSMKLITKHVSKAHNNALSDLLIPQSIPGLYV
jgi:hypothetical protein